MSRTVVCVLIVCSRFLGAPFFMHFWQLGTLSTSMSCPFASVLLVFSAPFVHVWEGQHVRGSLCFGSDGLVQLCMSVCVCARACVRGYLLLSVWVEK